MLVDRVLPNAPIRQWVLSLPFELRGLAAMKPDVLGYACSRGTQSRSGAPEPHGTCTAARAAPRSLVQRIRQM